MKSEMDEPKVKTELVRLVCENCRGEEFLLKGTFVFRSKRPLEIRRYRRLTRVCKKCGAVKTAWVRWAV